MPDKGFETAPAAVGPRPWGRFRAPGIGDVHDTLVALWALPRTRWRLDRAPLATVRVRGAGAVDHSSPVDDAPTANDEIAARRMARAVARAARLLPFECNCLVRSVALESLLHRRGITCELRFGIHEDLVATAFEAHAWVEYRGQALADSGAAAPGLRALR